MRSLSRAALVTMVVLMPIGTLRAETFPVTKAEDTRDGRCDIDCSLREAIDAANANPGVDQIPVPAGTYALTIGQLEVADDVEIAGAGSNDTVLDGNLSTRVLRVGSGASVAVSHVTIQSGYADDALSGGAILNLGNLALSSSVVTNSAVSHFYFQGNGGGIFNEDGLLALTDTTVSINSANGAGGGIYNSSGTVELTNSSIRRNSADDSGGGIGNRNGVLILNNSTVSGNRVSDDALEGAGGGIWNGGQMTLANSTVTGNSADASGGGISGRATLFGSIVADNTVENCSTAATSLGYNLADDASCGLGNADDLVVADAMLGALADNGGPTRTHSPLPGSPAIDAGPPDCPPPASDQRGVLRPQGDRCDIGAVEFVAAAAFLTIDIQPWSRVNEVRFSERRRISVAILGSEVVDVSEVDWTTLAFGPDRAAPLHDLSRAGVLRSHVRDVNHDGFVDLLMHYDLVQTGIEPADSSACITGEVSGARFEACDAIRVIDSNRRVVFPTSMNFTAGDFPSFVAVSDLDGDRVPDLVVVNTLSHDLSVLLGEGDGSFRPAVSYRVGTSPRTAAVGDLNGDAIPDLVAANAQSDDVTVLFGNGDGTFGAGVALAAGNGAGYVALADLDGDADLDIAAVSLLEDVGVLLGNGNGSFGNLLSSPTPSFPSSIALRDLDGDQILDLVTGSDADRVSILLGNGDGTFQTATTYPAGDGPRFVTVADLDADGALDLVTANGNADDVSVLRGNGTVEFADPVKYLSGGSSPSSPRAVAVGDFDLDRALDLAVVNAISDDVSVLFGSGDGTFGGVESFGVGDLPLWVATADLDGNRTLDLVVANAATDQISVHLNALRTPRRSRNRH